MAGMKILILTAALSITGSSVAQEVARVDPTQVRTEAKALRQKAKQMRTEAKAQLKAAEAACWKNTVLVSGCQADARDTHHKVERQARQIDLEALALERRLEALKRDTRNAEKVERARKEAIQAEKRVGLNRQSEEDRQRLLTQQEEKDKKLQLKAEKRKAKEAELERKLK